MDELKSLIKSFLGITLIVAMSFLLGCRYGRRTARIAPETTVVRDTVCHTIHDTITRERPVYVASYVYDTIRTHFTTVRHDTVLVDLPMERRVYQEDSLYRCVISGFKPQLDSLTVWPTITTITIREKVKTPSPRWSVGVTAGPSSLVTPKGQLHAGVGATVGLSYRF